MPLTDLHVNINFKKIISTYLNSTSIINIESKVKNSMKILQNSMVYVNMSETQKYND